MNKKIYKLHITLFLAALALFSLSAVTAAAVWYNRSFFFDQHIYRNASSEEVYSIIVYKTVANPDNPQLKTELNRFGDVYYYVVRAEDAKIFTNIPEGMDRASFSAQSNIITLDYADADDGGSYTIDSSTNTVYYDDSLNNSAGTAGLSGYIYVDKNGSGLFQQDFENGFSVQTLLYADTAGFFISLIIALPLFLFSFRKALSSLEPWIDKIPDDLRLFFCAINAIAVLTLFELYSGRMGLIFFLRDRLIYASLLIFFMFLLLIMLCAIIYKLIEYRKSPFMMKARWDGRFSRNIPLWISLMLWEMPLWLLWWLTVHDFSLLDFYYKLQMPTYQGGISLRVLLLQFIFMLLAALLTQAYHNARMKYGRAVLSAAELIADGNLEQTIPIYGEDISSETAEAINNIMEGYHHAINEQKKAERLKYELVTNISHDLRTPLTSVTNYIELIKKKNGEGALDTATLNQYISHADSNAKKLSVMVEDLFELSKMESGNMPLTITEINLNLLLRQVSHEYEPKAEIINSEIIFLGSFETVFISCDALKISRLFDNLLGNALKYSLPSTRIYIELIDEPGDATVIIRNTANYRLDFEPEELFIRFKRADEARTGEGSGLGLAIAKSITELHSGRINIETEGDLFRVIVTLPKKQS